MKRGYRGKTSKFALAVTFKAPTREEMDAFRQGLHDAQRTKRITALQEKIGLVLLEYMNRKTGRCDPSYAAIMDRVRCCRQTVRTALIAMKELELLDWTPRLIHVAASYGRRIVKQTSNAYRILTTAQVKPKPREIVTASNGQTRTPVSLQDHKESKGYGYEPVAGYDPAAQLTAEVASRFAPMNAARALLLATRQAAARQEEPRRKAWSAYAGPLFAR